MINKPTNAKKQPTSMITLVPKIEIKGLIITETTNWAKKNDELRREQSIPMPIIQYQNMIIFSNMYCKKHNKKLPRLLDVTQLFT